MSHRPQTEQHPVAFGLVALVCVALVVGVVAGVVALAGARVVGLDGETSSQGSRDKASLFLPRPKPTRASDGPLITLAPGQPSAGGRRSGEARSGSGDSGKPDKRISLQVASSQVSPMQNIDLTGVYPSGEGAILQVQRLEGGAWKDFPVTASVSNETFTTYVQTGQTGVNKFRMVDTDTDKASNVVTVTIR